MTTEKLVMACAAILGRVFRARQVSLRAVVQSITPRVPDKIRINAADRTPQAGAHYVFEFSNGNRRHVFCDGPADPAKFVGPQRLWRVFFDGCPTSSGPALLTDLIPKDHFRALCIGRVVDAPNLNIEKGKTKMNAVVPFEFEGTAVRVVDIDGEPWFVGKDVAERLGYTNPAKAMADHCKGVTKRYPLQTAGGMQEIRIVSEPDVLRLVVGSKLPSAERFERWVFEEVLPAIRKTGGYGVARIDVRNPDQLARIALQLIDVNKELQGRAETAERLIAEAKPKVEVYDRIAGADGTVCITDAAKSLQRRPKDLFSWLVRHGWIYRRAERTPYVGCQDKIEAGYLKHRVMTYSREDGGEKVVEAVRVTAKGLTQLATLFGVD